MLERLTQRCGRIIRRIRIDKEQGDSNGSGYEIEHCGKLSSLTLGPIEYKPVPACDSEAFARNEILVGLDFMKAFNYVFSYPDGIVVLTPRKNR